MNPVEKISIGGYAFTIEDTAVEAIGQYLAELKAYYDKIDSGNEVMEGIEERMAELLLEKSGFAGVVTIDDANSVINTLGRPETIESESSTNEQPGDAPDNGADDSFPKNNQGRKSSDKKNSDDKPDKKLYRDIDNGKILGVCSGLSNYFNVDIVVVRIVFVLLGISYWGLTVNHKPFIAFSIPVLVYLILGFITPPAKTVTDKHRMKGEGNTISEIQKAVQNSFNGASETIRSIGNSEAVRTGGNLFVKSCGVILLLLGFSGLFTGSVVIFWHNIFGFESFTTDILHKMMFHVPRLYTAFTLLWVKCIICLASFLPFILLIYSGLKMLIGFKSPKWHPGLIIFITWLLTLIMIFVIALLGSIPVR